MAQNLAECHPVSEVNLDIVIVDLGYDPDLIVCQFLVDDVCNSLQW